jgi:hypothetical protein
MALILLVLILAILFGGLGFALHALSGSSQKARRSYPRVPGSGGSLVSAAARSGGGCAAAA